jgi:hypothetical protein
VKLHLLQQLLDLNQAFDNVIHGLERMETLRLFNKEDLRYTRADIETARADTNRDFIDKLGEIVEKDSTLASCCFPTGTRMTSNATTRNRRRNGLPTGAGEPRGNPNRVP